MLKSTHGAMEVFAVATAAKAARQKGSYSPSNRSTTSTRCCTWWAASCTERRDVPRAPGRRVLLVVTLLGLRVVTEQGETLGELVDIIETGSNDVYVVQGNGRELLIPALEDVVLAVDLAEGIMKVCPPEGLLDL